MAVPKKRTSISKKNIRKNVWKKKGYWTALKAFSLAKSMSTGKSKKLLSAKSLSTPKPKPFFVRKIKNK